MLIVISSFRYVKMELDLVFPAPCFSAMFHWVHKLIEFRNRLQAQKLSIIYFLQFGRKFYFYQICFTLNVHPSWNSLWLTIWAANPRSTILMPLWSEIDFIGWLCIWLAYQLTMQENVLLHCTLLITYF